MCSYLCFYVFLELIGLQARVILRLRQAFLESLLVLINDLFGMCVLIGRPCSIDILQRQMTILLHSLFVLVNVVTLAASVENIDHLLHYEGE